MQSILNSFFSSFAQQAVAASVWLVSESDIDCCECVIFINSVCILAIRVALAYGLEVFTTVSTPAKKKFIMDTFPQLKGRTIHHFPSCALK